MSAVRIVMVLWGGLFLALGMLKPPGDGDLWWQRWLGEAILRTHHLPMTLGPETFSAAGAPWVPQEWILSLLVAVSMDRGAFDLLRLAVAAIPVAVMLSIVTRSRSRGAPAATAVVLLFTGAALVGSFGVRAQVLGWGCFALFLLCLERRDGWYFGAIPVVALWANLHASAMLAPVFLAARVAGAVFDDGWAALRTNRDLRILALVALGVLCTPFGWRLPAYAVTLALSPIRHYIQEWQPTRLTDPPFLYGALPIALAIALGGVRMAWQRKAEGLPILMLFMAMLLARRDVALFAIAAAPLAAEALSRRFPGVAKLSERTRELERFAIVATCVALAFTATAFALRLRDAPPAVPIAAMARLAAGPEQRLFCEDFAGCSLALQYPRLHVFMDGRCDPYPLPIWKSYMAVIQRRTGWRATLARYGVTAVVASKGGSFARAMSAQLGWRRSFDDGSFVVFSRT